MQRVLPSVEMLRAFRMEREEVLAMKQTTLHNLTKADKIAKQILNISAVILFSMLLLWLVWSIISNIASSVRADMVVKSVFKIAGGVALSILLLSVVVRMVLSLFVRSDDENDFEEKVDYVLQQKKTAARKAGQKSETISVLVGLSAEQEEMVCRLLRELPSHINSPQKINMAEVSHYLTALRDLGYLNDKDKYNLYAWVGKITDKELPQFNHFSEAYPSTTVKKVNHAKEKITSELQKLR